MRRLMSERAIRPLPSQLARDNLTMRIGNLERPMSIHLFVQNYIIPSERMKTHSRNQPIERSQETVAHDSSVGIGNPCYGAVS